MKRGLATACATLVLTALPAVVACAPLSDGERGDWAYQAIQSLAAHGIIDGYPDGTFKGDRPPTRNEMAALTARAIAKVEADGATKADLETVQQLIDALKDELDALGVRVTNLEESLGSLQDRSTAPPQLSRHSSAPAQPNLRATKADVERAQRLIDALKDKLDALGVRVTNIQEVLGSREDRTKLARRSPLHVDLVPERSVGVKGGDLANFPARGELDSMPSALAGLVFSANERAIAPPYEAQSYLKGASRSSRLSGLSDLYFSVSRLDRTLLDADATVMPLRLGPLAVNRIFKGEDAQPPESTTAAAGNYNLIGEAVFGIDAAVPAVSFGVLRPTLYRAATTVLSPSDRNMDARVLFAATPRVDVASAPHQYFASESDASTFTTRTVFPRFFGAANDLALGDQTGTSASFERTPPTPINPSLTQAIPLFNAFETYEPNLYSASVPNAAGLHLNMSVPLRVGSLFMHGNVGVTHVQETVPNSFGAAQYCAGLAGCTLASGQRASDDQLSAGTTFDIRALGRRISLNLGGSYGRLYRPEVTAFPYVPYDPTSQSLEAGTLAAPPGGSSPITFNPNYVNVSQRAVNAAAAVPLTRDLTLNLQYNTQYYTGSYETLGQNVDERKDFYLGNLTYVIPRTSSSIVFSAKQYHYRDAFVPTYNVTQNRADLNFTIKF